MYSTLRWSVLACLASKVRRRLAWVEMSYVWTSTFGHIIQHFYAVCCHTFLWGHMFKRNDDKCFFLELEHRAGISIKACEDWLTNVFTLNEWSHPHFGADCFPYLMGMIKREICKSSRPPTCTWSWIKQHNNREKQQELLLFLLQLCRMLPGTPIPPHWQNVWAVCQSCAGP